MKLKDLAGLDSSLNDLTHYAQSPFLFNQQQETFMSNNNSIPISAKSIDFESEFLLIFTKMRRIEGKLDIIFKALNPDPEALLSQSEKDMIISQRSETWTNVADITPTGS